MSNTTITPTIGAVALAGVAPSLASLGAWGRSGDSSGQLITWTGLTNLLAGLPYPPLGQPNPGGWGGFESVSLQANGTFGAAGSVQLEGSNDGVNWYKLSPAALSAAGITVSLGVGERPRYLRPNVTAGDGTTLLNMNLWVTYGP